MFKVKEFNNGLTDLLKAEPNLPLHEFLLHRELGPAVKNEADAIIFYLTRIPRNSKTSETNFAKLARYALTDEWKDDIP
jgi:hypothetical protein